MPRVKRWIASVPIPRRRRRSGAGQVSVVVGAGMVMGLILGATSGQFGRLLKSARRAVDEGNSVVLTDRDSGNGVQKKAPPSKPLAGSRR